ncbi:putative flavohemoglobin [Dinoroseobacter shibae DFL 12 = DSM 16493]|jgi:nitric oxide dioxygenase|uniref:Putative flavohemoglobin n=1 Tax=Dinoroseobacter shibae (strain DSM 16493 / NCIMB 14021 / DFL 12) TaxID=398580 RepID=A8LLN0_DINSH|nr:globin domain-containing protein [Dinoroseobacter shibae]ABV93408.1 putative flavohemoglobin [Dinoroseobacter shibae DFL 12 = DSM 16493]URF48322.1 globin domain-containing protein [Dinoroseobacter shibae]URF52632.1 globin domain-containing protein [Dinoroseobacter shibae]
MTQDEITLIQRSFSRIFAQKARFGALFYERFFALNPEARAMFQTSITRQSEMLIEALALVVRGMRTDGALPPKALQMAARHGRYGVTPDHYAQMGEALMDTLAEVLGDAFDTETREAWQRAYGRLSEIMIAAAAEPAPDAMAANRNTS